MNQTTIKISDYQIIEYCCNTVVVGSGAAGYNAANRLWQYGNKDILLVTEDRLAGTSRNTGSDKQTYYKLTLSGEEPDSVGSMAQTLFSGECVDGDLALCEAALSTRCFLQLVELGVAFPKNRFGEYIGYKTDHDPRRRATSVGPYTSREMTEKLEKAVLEKGIPILDHALVIKILSDGRKCYGLLCLDTKNEKEQNMFLIRSENVIWATGGPAGMYANSVYPLHHYGATGLALEAGAVGKNLTEWQYGLASVSPRWNVSGTYMQTLPRFISTDENGEDEQEFLMDFFNDRYEMLSKVFMKGYQWPFDVRKVANGSSVIDILVYLETMKGRKVYLDFRSNPSGYEIDFSRLEPEAYQYLKKAEACFGTPYDRLIHMNQPAVDFYLEKGLDLKKEPMEIALCAQHNNGGIGINSWWQSNVKGFFVCGEAAASHGVYRPGGSALNAGQVGSTRAAEYISYRRSGQPEKRIEYLELAEKALSEMQQLAAKALSPDCSENKMDVEELWKLASVQMSQCGGAFRDEMRISPALEKVTWWIEHYADMIKTSPEKLTYVYRLRDMLISQKAYLGAMLDYLKKGGQSRGSSLYTDMGGQKPYPKLPDTFTFVLDEGKKGEVIQEVLYKNGKLTYTWRTVRPIPDDDDFFENVWKTFRENGNVDI